MPRVTIQKTDYDEIVWPAVALRVMGEGEDPAVADTLLTKLEGVGAPAELESEGEEALPPAEDTAYVMAADSDDLDLTDAEAELLAARLAGERRRHTTRRMRALLPLMQPLEEAVEAARTARAAAELDTEISARRDMLESLSQDVAAARSEIARLQDEITRTEAQLEPTDEGNRA